MPASGCSRRDALPSSDGMNPVLSTLWRGAAALLALAGVAGFIWLFARRMDLYWFILSPLILADRKSVV